MDAEQAAQGARRGIWQYDFQAPWEWRQSKQKTNSERERTAVVSASDHSTHSTNGTADTSHKSGDCTIKGNISRSGERIYHTTASPWYKRTRIDQSKGEKWFCSEEEAQLAGWRSGGY